MVAGTGTAPDVAILWTTPPPSTVTSGDGFTVVWSITGAATVEHINVHWDTTDPTAITTCSSETSCSTVSPTSSPANLIAPLVSVPTVVKYAVHTRVNGDGVNRFSDVIAVTVNPSPTLQPPNVPAAPQQFKSDGATLISVGSTTTESTVIFKATVSDPNGDQVRLQIDLRRLDEFGGSFPGEWTQQSDPVVSGGQAKAIAFGLINGNYHWRARTVNATGSESEWVSFGGNAAGAADFIVDRPASAPDLAILSIRPFTPDDPQGRLVQGKDSFIEVKIQNVGTADLPASNYLISVTVWDLKSTGLNTTEANKNGRALIDSYGFPIALPRISPNEIKTIFLPTVGRQLVFSSALFSDELRVVFLPAFPEAPAFDSNPDNDVAVLGPGQFQVISIEGRVVLNCAEEIWAVTTTVISTAILLGNISILTPLGITYVSATAAYAVTKISTELFFEFQLAVSQGRYIEAGQVLSRAITNTALLVAKLVDPATVVLSLLPVAATEIQNVGCLKLLQDSDAKKLMWSLFQGLLQDAASLFRDVFWFLGGSPIDLVVMDSAGRRVAVRFDGTVESEILKAVAFRIGDASTRVIAIPGSDTYTFNVLGSDIGTARVGLMQPRLDGHVSTVIYEDVPVRQNSSATVVVDSTTTEYPLHIDLNGSTETRSPTSIEISSPVSTSPLVVATSSLPVASLQIPYSFALEASGGKPPYRFTVDTGSLPSGIGLLGTGGLVGTPTAGGLATFVVKVEDLVGSSTTAAFNLKVNRSPIANAGSDQTVDEGSNVTLNGTASSDPDGDALTFNWTQLSGPLVSISGANSPNPTFTAPFVGPSGTTLTFQLVTNDGLADSAPASVNIAVRNTVPLSIGVSTLGDAEQGLLYNKSLQISGGPAPYVVKIVKGSLPLGLNIDNQGIISGTPSPNAKTTRFTVQVTDQSSASTTKPFKIITRGALSVTTKSLKAGTQGIRYKGAVAAKGGKTPYSWSLVSGDLPPGLTLDGSTGAITGVPTQQGTFSPTFKVTDSLGGQAQKNFTLTIK